VGRPAQDAIRAAPAAARAVCFASRF
jgi:hypothetical protein